MRGLRRRLARIGAASLVLVLAVGAATCRGRGGASVALEQRVDSMLPALERLSGLEAREPVRVRRQSTDALRAFVERQLRDELSAREVAGMEAAYKEFGLLPDTLDLRSLLLELYSEQVVGYYDPETEALYVREEVEAGALEPVLAHELVHAIQDQHTDLDALIAPERGNDARAAAQAAIEGHATIAMVAFMAERQSGSPVDPTALPDLGAQLRPALEAQNADFPVFASAPRLIRETMLFSYLGGASFVQALWRGTAAAANATGPAASSSSDAAPPVPLGDLLPLSTEQVLHPHERFLDRRDPPTRIRLEEAGGEAGAEAGAGAPGEATRAYGSWRVVYENGLGELETAILLEVHGEDPADSLAAGWDGDRYRVWESDEAVRLIEWFSVWDTGAAADRFADAYGRVLDRRGRAGAIVERMAVEGRPAVRVLEGASAIDPERAPRSRVRSLAEVTGPALDPPDPPADGSAPEAP
ncbi:MAG: DUF6782 family putative metallopeptidase [Gemmatimonadota bacterium]